MTNITSPNLAVQWAWDVIKNNAAGPTNVPTAPPKPNPNLPVANPKNLIKAARELGYQLGSNPDGSTLSSIQPRVQQNIMSELQKEHNDIINEKYGKIGSASYKKMLAEYTQANKDFKSGDWAGAAKIEITFKGDAGKYLKAQHKHAKNGGHSGNGSGGTN